MDIKVDLTKLPVWLASWKTTAGGVASFLTAVAALLMAWHDGKAPDWNSIGAMLYIAYLGIVSKDHDK